MTPPLVQLASLRFRYPRSDFALHVPELTVARGEAVAFTGPSGSGKTTLLHLIAGIRTPDRGTVTVDGVSVCALSEAARRAFRIRHVGLIFQEFELIEYLHVLDNILLPYRLGPTLALDDAVRARAAELARQVGLGGKERRFVGCLSQGERQRVALCRALLPRPGLLLADEPTGSLDPTNKLRVLDLLFDCAREAAATLVLVTHDRELLGRFARVVDFRQFHAAPPPRPASAANEEVGR